MRDSTVAIHRIVKKRGVPHASGLRVGGIISYRHDRSSQRIKTGNNQVKSPTRKPDAWATQFVPRLTSGPPAHHRFVGRVVHLSLTFFEGITTALKRSTDRPDLSKLSQNCKSDRCAMANNK